MSVLHDAVGCRTFELPPAATVRDVKALIAAETGFPRAQQRLQRGGREVSEPRRGRPRPALHGGLTKKPWGGRASNRLKRQTPPCLPPPC